MSAGQWKRPYFLYKFHGQPDYPFLRSFRFIPRRRNCKIRYFIVQLVSTCGLRVYMAHLVPEPSLTFFYDVSCFSIIKHTDLSSWNFIHYFNLSAQRISTNRPDVSLQKGNLVSCALRVSTFVPALKIADRINKNDGGEGEGGKQKTKRKRRKEMPTIKMSSNEV